LKVKTTTETAIQHVRGALGDSQRPKRSETQKKGKELKKGGEISGIQAYHPPGKKEESGHRGKVLRGAN